MDVLPTKVEKEETATRMWYQTPIRCSTPGHQAPQNASHSKAPGFVEK
jgi:hypothetical protein